ncbi:lipoate--protein ligase family protein [Rubrobacter indicoceani]|uniref:lipoate--protein ligase family protein n=1 Tax=Rubrobacter indicoceani TaxID=2051957 RepID=UPI0013C426D7|nr:lipoate--protein ligase family protein [Rubrobacter indicoceani]
MKLYSLPFVCFSEPEDGFGLQQAVLEAVGTGRLGATMLLWSSSPYVAATRLEARSAGFGAAVSRARTLGFPVMVRNSGGGAVAANEGSVSFSLTFPVADLRQGLYERYDEGVEVVAAALRRVGVAAEGGEVEGEFCPGAYSVRSGGWAGVKHAGLAQRVTKRAARIEALVLAEGTRELVPVLKSVYAALDKPFRAACLGDVEAGRRGIVEALEAEVAARYALTETALPEDLSERSRELRGGWRV